LQVEGRAANDLQEVARRGLVLQRLFEVARALAQFAKQLRILHRDNRLRREVFKECNFLVRERPGLASSYRNRAEQRVVFA